MRQAADPNFGKPAAEGGKVEKEKKGKEKKKGEKG
jgi:hypothetical protein